MSQAIIDSHVHFWDPAYLRYEWLEEVPAINRPFLPKDLWEQTADLALEGIVFVQADCVSEDSLREVEWVTELAKSETKIQAIVAFVPLELGSEAREMLDKLAKMPLVKGVRRLIQAEAAGFAVQPAFVAGVQALSDYDFSFDICILHHQLGDVLRLVEQCPEVRFVLDHLGKPDAKKSVFEPWATQISELAQFPQVYCKLSGLVTEADHRRWTREELQPYIAHVVQAFGVERIMYGGDWPVSLLATTYREWVETLRWATADLTAANQHKLFYQNAQRFYFDVSY
jgi:L-fuconolactonase